MNEPTLKLVGGEEQDWDGLIHIDYGDYYIELQWSASDQVYMWGACGRHPIANGVANDYNSAIEVAEKALLEEVGKFVRIKL